MDITAQEVLAILVQKERAIAILSAQLQAVQSERDALKLALDQLQTRLTVPDSGVAAPC